MAKKNNFTGFKSAANQRLGEIAEKKAAPSPPEDPYAKLSDEEKFALETAIVNGYPDVSPYAEQAMAKYQSLLDEAEAKAKAWHYEPDTEDYNNAVNRLISMNWGDDQLLGLDQVSNMYNLYNTNKQAKQKAQTQDNLRYQAVQNMPVGGVAPASSSSVGMLTNFFSDKGIPAAKAAANPFPTMPQVQDDWNPYSPDGVTH